VQNYSKFLIIFFPNFVVLIGEIANFVAYMFAPAVLVTPLGALSIIVRYNWDVFPLLVKFPG
jgi:hypothetical protein